MRRSLAPIVLVAAALLETGCTTGAFGRKDNLPSTPRCLPTQPCWPSLEAWQQLRASLTGKLEAPQHPLQSCGIDPASPTCAVAIDNLKNPFYIQDQPGGTQSLGLLGAWTAAPSAYSVAAESAKDVAAAVIFAKKHKLPLTIKGTGHDYLGRSSSPNSLLIWTHKMRRIAMHDAFVPGGCRAAERGIPAVTVGAGTRWLETYAEVSVKNHRYVQGGGCTSVGAAGGFIQGGGFGSWSKKYGIAAAGMLEAEVVTADGEVLVANACQNQDLFWALRGGGGGTFGIVTEVTLMTHPLPTYFGFVLGNVTAKTDQAFLELIEHFVTFYGQHLNNESWGEQVVVKGNNSLRLSMSFQGMSAEEAERVWQPFRVWVERRPDRFTLEADVVAVPGDKMWDHAFIERNFGRFIEKDKRPEQSDNLFWWAANQSEIARYWYSYQSRWIPFDSFRGAASKKFAAVLFEASRHWPLELHFNKGQSGASREAIRRGRETSMNPAVYDAAALVIAAAAGRGYPGVRGHEPDAVEGEAERARVTAAMKLVRDATPGAGSYVNETDYFEPNWQREFWGTNYERLLEVKRKYDPEGLFRCHHCVGSE
jgi:FAD/FMN-containing dehydrogenase